MACNCGCSQKKKCSKKSYGSYTKYVKGGLCEPGDGSKCRPWNSLALAQSGSWETLVVLSSPIALDGGILLKDGQKLVGEKSPVDGPLEYDQPTITNTDLLSNGGNGVLVQSGSVSVKNLHFTNTQVSAINYDNAKDLLVKEVLVTGHNQSQTAVDMGYTDSSGRTKTYNGGIHGQNAHNGKAVLCKVVIRDNFSGSGVYDVSINGASRELKVIKSEFSAIKRNGIDDEAPFDISTIVYGATSVATGLGSKKTTKYYKSTAFDFKSDFPFSGEPSRANVIRTMGFGGESYQGGDTTFTVEKCNGRNINVKDGSRGDFVYGWSLDALEGINNKLTVNVICSTYTSDFNDALSGFPGDSRGISVVCDDEATYIALFKDNTVSNVRVGITSNGRNTTEVIEGNNIRATAESVALGQLGPGKNYNGTIRKNNLVLEGNPNYTNFDALAIGHNEPWDSYILVVEDNCMENVSGGFYETVYITNDPGNPSLDIQMRNNNIISNTGVVLYLEGVGTGLLNARNNYWSPLPVENVTYFNDSNVTVFVDSELSDPIECPKKKFCIPETTVFPESVSLSVKSLTEEEKFESRKNRKREFN